MVHGGQREDVLQIEIGRGFGGQHHGQPDRSERSGAQRVAVARRASAVVAWGALGVLAMGALTGCADAGVDERPAAVADRLSTAPASPAQQVSAGLAAEGIEEFADNSSAAIDELGASVCDAWDRGVRQVFVVDVISSEYPTLSEYEVITVASTVSRAYCPPN